MAAGFACRSAVFRTLPLVHLREFGIQQPARPLLCRRTPAAGTLAAAAAPKYAGLPPEQQQQVDAFVDILLDWNQRMNLTGALRLPAAFFIKAGCRALNSSVS